MTLERVSSPCYECGMRQARALASIIAFILLLAGCGGYSLTLDEDQKQAVAVNGWNLMGRTDLDIDDWFEIISDACADEPDSEATRSSIVAEWELDRLVTTDQAMEAVWIMAIQVCRDRFPAEH